MKILELKNVNKIYNSSEVKVHAVNEVTLDFIEAEFGKLGWVLSIWVQP